MFTGAVHNTGTPCGSFFVFFCFASVSVTENVNDNNATATAIRLRYGFPLSISNTPFWTGLQIIHMDWGKSTARKKPIAVEGIDATERNLTVNLSCSQTGTPAVDIDALMVGVETYGKTASVLYDCSHR